MHKYAHAHNWKIFVPDQNLYFITKDYNSQNSMSAPAIFPWLPKWTRMNFPWRNSTNEGPLQQILYSNMKPNRSSYPRHLQLALCLQRHMLTGTVHVCVSSAAGLITNTFKTLKQGRCNRNALNPSLYMYYPIHLCIAVY